MDKNNKREKIIKKFIDLFKKIGNKGKETTFNPKIDRKHGWEQTEEEYQKDQKEWLEKIKKKKESKM